MRPWRNPTLTCSVMSMYTLLCRAAGCRDCLAQTPAVHAIDVSYIAVLLRSTTDARSWLSTRTCLHTVRSATKDGLGMQKLLKCAPWA